MEHKNGTYVLLQLLCNLSALSGFQVDAVRLIAAGKAPRITQPKEGATYECIQKKDNSKVIYKDIQAQHSSRIHNPALEKKKS